ncbi:MAG: hypothetical protein AABX11_02480 [Nanoarchaeota archaeon]
MNLDYLELQKRLERARELGTKRAEIPVDLAGEERAGTPVNLTGNDGRGYASRTAPYSWDLQVKPVDRDRTHPHNE